MEGSQLAKAKAKGTPEDRYALLPSYWHVLKTMNPGSVIKLKKDPDERFKYFYLAFGPSIRGFTVQKKV